LSFRIGEVVRSGNATAVVKNYYPDTGFLVLMNIEGNITVGSTVIGDDSGAVKTFSTFTLSDDFDLNYAATNFDDTTNFVILDDGEHVALDLHFDGKESQDLQSTYVVTL
jgi:hypothetical protein